VNPKHRLALWIVAPLVICGVATMAAGSRGKGREPQNKTRTGLVAHYTFTEKDGKEVHDQSGNHHDGTIIGDYSWGQSGLQLDGASYIRIPDAAALNLKQGFSIAVSFRGKGSDFRMVERPKTGGTNNIRGPYFQVCGDELSFTYNADVLSQGLLNEKGLRDSVKYQRTFWPASYGSTFANLSSWSEQYLGVEGVEPKMQRVFDKVYYEYFGRDGTGVLQIWTGISDIHGEHFAPTQRTRQVATSYSDTYLSEQGNLQVASGRIYYAWVEMDEKHQWQLWTAMSRLDGSGFSASQRTVDSGWVPQLQVAGDSIYYMYAGSDARGLPGEPLKSMYFAKSNLDGSNWRIVATISGISQTVGGLRVDRDRIFFGYSKLDADGSVEAVTGSMDLDGRRLTELPLGKHLSALAWPVQVVAERVYYVILYWDGADDAHPGPWKYWIASTRRDGSDWKSRPFANGTPNIYAGYKFYVMVGEKEYYGLTRTLNFEIADESPLLGTEGANLVSKGDSFGIGLSSGSAATGFVNVGEDYLCRGEAPLDTAGTAVSSAVQGDGPHQLAEVYDGHTLRLFVDGNESVKTEYATPPADNQFPLLLGDGLVGSLQDVKLFNTALSAAEIEKLYKNESAELDHDK
jgi:hypothetical protein